MGKVTHRTMESAELWRCESCQCENSEDSEACAACQTTNPIVLRDLVAAIEAKDLAVEKGNRDVQNRLAERKSEEYIEEIKLAEKPRSTSKKRSKSEQAGEGAKAAEEVAEEGIEEVCGWCSATRDSLSTPSATEWLCCEWCRSPVGCVVQFLVDPVAEVPVWEFGVVVKVLPLMQVNAERYIVQELDFSLTAEVRKLPMKRFRFEQCARCDDECSDCLLMRPTDVSKVSCEYRDPLHKGATIETRWASKDGFDSIDATVMGMYQLSDLTPLDSSAMRFKNLTLVELEYDLYSSIATHYIVSWSYCVDDELWLIPTCPFVAPGAARVKGDRKRKLAAVLSE